MEQREFQGMIGLAWSLRLALGVDGRCGDYIGQFSILLKEVGGAYWLDARE